MINMEGLKNLITSSLNNLKNLKHLLNNQEDLKHVPYGTAGFRGKAEDVEHLFFRVGLIAGMRCWYQQANVGVMVTASHNPIHDNGVKIIDSSGEMLESKWERIVEEFCNYKAHTIDDLVGKMFSLVEMKPDGDLPPLERQSAIDESRGHVFIGYDTRPSSEKLVYLIQEALNAWTIIKYKIMGEITTPALHFIVGQATLTKTNLIDVKNYYGKLLRGVKALHEVELMTASKQHYNRDGLVIDCANGVGARTMKYLLVDDDSPFREYLPIKLVNTGDHEGDILNHECGADYVKTKHLPPKNAHELNTRYASIDGDADRVVYFYLKKYAEDGRELVLLDGDKILALFARYLSEMLKKYNLDNCLTLGAVQTAYANGASTNYLIEQLGSGNVDCVETGVKHLHKRALIYDLGVYFEANGHGTIWVSEKAKALVAEKGINEFKLLLDILNNYTGDAISDILIVEMILNHYDWDAERWDKLYTDRPNSLIKVEVPDRSLVVTTNAGRTCLKPAGLQVEIDNIVSQFGTSSRSFVRASGTENVIRIYAESDDQIKSDQLAQKVGQKVIEYCNK